MQGITPKKRKRSKMFKRLRQAQEEMERAAAEELTRMVSDIKSFKHSIVICGHSIGVKVDIN